MTPLERRYRRTLRLLPPGYRQIWEEDMVDAYMESASHHGGDATSARSWREHLSVLGLAVRLRLSGAHASPRGLAWRAAVHGFSLVALLYMALGGIFSVTHLLRTPSALFQTPASHTLYLWGALCPAPLWAAAFVTVVLARVAAARLLVLLAFLAQIGVMIAHILLEAAPFIQFGVPTPYITIDWRQAVEMSVANGVWLAIVTAATLMAPAARPSKPGRERWFWLGGGALLAVLQVPAVLLAAAGYRFRFWAFAHPYVLVHVGLFAAMVAALVVRRNPRWLLALALFVVVFAGNELLDEVRALLEIRSAGLVYIGPVVGYRDWFDFGLVALAVACATVGLIGLGRLPRVPPAAAQA